VAINLSIGVGDLWGQGSASFNVSGLETNRWAEHVHGGTVGRSQDPGITYLAGKWCGAAVSTELVPKIDEADRPAMERAGQAELDRMNLNPLYTIGSSLLFEAFVVVLAIRRFSRTDY
jgi:hypothetical protein